MKGKIFNIQEVEAIIAGKKTMFRELIKKPLAHFNNITINQDGEVSAYNKTRGWYEDLKNIKCPYKVGQEIFVALKMPKWASRLTLRIKSVKVERLQYISEEDAIKEGVPYEGGCEVPSITFKMIWNSTHKKQEEKWEANPWVFVYGFEVIK